jgi:hypothetical protein
VAGSCACGVGDKRGDVFVLLRAAYEALMKGVVCANGGGEGVV